MGESRIEDERAELYGTMRGTSAEAAESEEVEACTEARRAAMKSVHDLLPLLPRDCARFTQQHVYAKPSQLLQAMVSNFPEQQRLNEDQRVFALRFGDVLDRVHREEQELPPEKRGVHHMLLLGQGGSGKTHLVQNLIFPAVHFIWPPDEGDSLMVVAAKNAQAKNISTQAVRAKTLHAASCMRVQSLSNAQMGVGTKEKTLQRLWGSVRVLVIEEVSMVAAAWYNMLDFRSMLGRRLVFKVDAQRYSKVGCAFGRVPIVLHLGDFYQLRPTAQLSLVDDLERKSEDGVPVHRDVPVEGQHAQKVFGAIPDVFELRGTMRFKKGDPLIDVLRCMRLGQKFPEKLWERFAQRFAKDASPGVADPRLTSGHFATGFAMSIYWASLARMMNRRTIVDASRCGQVLVMLQSADVCLDLDRDALLRFLNQPNPHRTGLMHGVLPCYLGMPIRFLAKMDAEEGLVQDTTGTIMDIEFHSADRARFLTATPGDIFVPRFLPSGLWVSVDGYRGCKDWEGMFEICSQHGHDRDEAERLARSLWFLPAEEVVVPYNKCEVRRCGFRCSHAKFLTSTGSQGITLRQGTIVDCARLPELDDDNWWLHLYVMFSRVTSLDDLLLLRPPPRELLERGPPTGIRERTAAFQAKAERCRQGVAAKHGIGAA